MKRGGASSWGLGKVGFLLGASLLLVLALPLFGLVLSPSLADLEHGLSHPLFVPALWLSLRTTLVSVAITVLTGTPLSWWLSTSRSRLVGAVELLVHLPIVLPPAVVGVARRQRPLPHLSQRLSSRPLPQRR